MQLITLQKCINDHEPAMFICRQLHCTRYIALKNGVIRQALRNLCQCNDHLMPSALQGNFADVAINCKGF